ncbi:hypothetical protein [Actinopolymorpha alba]|uniref:hypothetical protein n=1 Tax=Actinopolymorpha alba TaxID=533267 RepID=UPI0009FE1A3C|nr:hypothetical protein [Actinopolymorpha alba]
MTYAVKYGPLVYEAVKYGREPAQRAIQKALARQGNRRQALRHATTVVDGSVLRVFHQAEPVWVVFAGDAAVASYPPVDVPLPAVLEHADLSLRVRPPVRSGRAPGVPRVVRKALGRSKSPPPP